jgi:hypothetical protein
MFKLLLTVPLLCAKTCDFYNSSLIFRFGHNKEAKRFKILIHRNIEFVYKRSSLEFMNFSSLH